MTHSYPTLSAEDTRFERGSGWLTASNRTYLATRLATVFECASFGP
jgi:hypothetical protein